VLLITSFLGSIIGFLVCYRTIAKLHHVADPIRMRVCMLNSMALAFIFAMLIELTTGSKPLAVILPLLTVCIPLLFLMKPLNVLDVVESVIASLMSTSMSVMLIGMVDTPVVWLIQCCLLGIEIVLYVAVIRDVRWR
jgi:hypothetical protein